MPCSAGEGQFTTSLIRRPPWPRRTTVPPLAGTLVEPLYRALAPLRVSSPSVDVWVPSLPRAQHPPSQLHSLHRAAHDLAKRAAQRPSSASVPWPHLLAGRVVAHWHDALIINAKEAAQELYQTGTRLALFRRYPAALVHPWHTSVLRALHTDNLPLLQLQRMTLLRLLEVRRPPQGYGASDCPFCHGPTLDLSAHLAGGCRAYYLMRVDMFQTLLYHLVRVTTPRHARSHRGLAVCDATGTQYTILDPVQRAAAPEPPGVDISPSGHAHANPGRPELGHDADHIVQNVLAAAAHPDHTLQWALGRCGLEPPANGAGPRLSFRDEVLLQYVLRALDRWVLRVRYGLQQPLPALSGVLGRPAAVVYMCIHELDIEFALSQPTEAASTARVYLIDTDHEWAVRHTHADHLHTTGLAPRRCVLWDPRTPWTD